MENIKVLKEFWEMVKSEPGIRGGLGQAKNSRKAKIISVSKIGTLTPDKTAIHE